MAADFHARLESLQAQVAALESKELRANARISELEQQLERAQPRTLEIPSKSPEIEKLAQDAVVPRRIACPRHLHVLLWKR